MSQVTSGVINGVAAGTALAYSGSALINQLQLVCSGVTGLRLSRSLSMTTTWLLAVLLPLVLLGRANRPALVVSVRRPLVLLPLISRLSLHRRRVLVTKLARLRLIRAVLLEPLVRRTGTLRRVLVMLTMRTRLLLRPLLRRWPLLLLVPVRICSSTTPTLLAMSCLLILLLRSFIR